jgi:hypothetical protein
LFGASAAVNYDVVPIPCLCVLSPKQPSAHAAASLLADSTDEVPISRIPPRSPLLSCDSGAEVLIPCPMLSCSSSTSHPSVCSRLPRRLVAMALLGIFSMDLLRLLPCAPARCGQCPHMWIQQCVPSTQQRHAACLSNACHTTLDACMFCRPTPVEGKHCQEPKEHVHALISANCAMTPNL